MAYKPLGPSELIANLREPEDERYPAGFCLLFVPGFSSNLKYKKIDFLFEPDYVLRPQEVSMLPTDKQRLFEFLNRLIKGLAAALGKNCEIVVHDFSDPERSIVAIANGHVTGRQVGDTLDALGFQLLQRPQVEDLLNYQSKMKDGRVLRSSSVFLRDESGDIFGAVCVNTDVTVPLKIDQWLKDVIQFDVADLDEKFEHSVDEVLDRLIQTAIRGIGKVPAEFTREDKIEVISQLEAKGTFLIRYSVDRVAELLHLSKYTIYGYLEEIKSRRLDSEKAGTGVAGK